jgi:hypothetical protein
MTTKTPPGPGNLIMLALLAAGAFYCGVDAILSESVTTPAKVGDGKRVYGTDTIFVGVGWILAGLAFTAKIILARRNARAGTVVAVVFAATGGLSWLVAVS